MKDKEKVGSSLSLIFYSKWLVFSPFKNQADLLTFYFKAFLVVYKTHSAVLPIPFKTWKKKKLKVDAVRFQDYSNAFWKILLRTNQVKKFEQVT